MSSFPRDPGPVHLVASNGDLPKRPKGPNNTGEPPGGHELLERINELEGHVVKIGMDLSYMRGRAEDAPTKDWVNEKLGRQTTIVLAAMAIGMTALGIFLSI